MTSSPRIEQNGINIINEEERRGSARSLFWPWCAANLSLLALSYGSFLLGFGISFWQATFAGLVGTVLSFALVGVSSLAGKRSSAPTMTLSRASFGVRGNIVPGILSYLIFLGWETVLVALATLATKTVLTRFADINENFAYILGFIIAASLTIFGGVLGFKVIMKMQVWITSATALLTIGYIAFTIDHVDWNAIVTMKSGSIQGFVGAIIFAITGIGLGWVNSAADYSRYLPRTVSGRSVIGWTVFGASLVPIILVTYGSLLAGSSAELGSAIAADPIGALTTLLPSWYLIPFAIVAILGLIGGAILNLYSSGITLVSLGVPIKRHQAASIDGVVMLLGTIYIVWFAPNFFGPFQGFLITLGVPIAVWSAIFVADVMMRKCDYHEADLFDPEGRYGSWNPTSVALMVAGTVVGWGLVTNTFASWLGWQGYLLWIVGGKNGPWAYANLGILAALLIGFVGHMIFGKKTIKEQESY